MAGILAATTQRDPCPYCGDLREDTLDMPLRTWLESISQTTCGTCSILRQALNILFPGKLEALPRDDPDSSVNVWSPLCSKISVMVNGSGRWVWAAFQLRTIDLGDEDDFRDIAAVAGDESMWEFIRLCLSTCLNGHEKCHATQDSTWYPSRLIEISSDEHLRLVDTRAHSPKSRYITLSHCWGENLKSRTTNDNLRQMCIGIEFAELPPTFRDCITAARKLGISYVWIDALCIIQDNISDWAQQSQVMDRVYQNALFTVAACASPDSIVPFLGPDAPTTRDVLKCTTIDFAMHGRMQKAMARKIDSSFAMWKRSPLESRGWAWQERHLSSRTINFLDGEVVWKCLSAEFQEHGRFHDDEQVPQDPLHTEKPNYSTYKFLTSKPTFAMWERVISDYSIRTLTFHADKLPAISGTAARFAQNLESRYMAGLWIDDWPRCLTWYVTRTDYKQWTEPRPGCLYDSDAPSWSWASVPDRAEWWNDHERDGWDCSAHLIRSDCRPASDNAFGPVMKDSYLDVQGRVIEATLEWDIHSNRGSVRRPGLAPQIVAVDGLLVRHKSDECKSTDTNDIVRQDVFSRIGRARLGDHHLITHERIVGVVSCLLLGILSTEKYFSSGARVLVLSKTSTSGDHDTYERIAIGIPHATQYRRHSELPAELEGEYGVREDWQEWFADAEIKTLRIV